MCHFTLSITIMKFGIAVLPLAIRYGGIWDVPFYPDNFFRWNLGLPFHLGSS